ncbi:hypothetical protein DNHGIG_25530 [Collibacillus ludicampi]|uniref:rRNA biogenesis protein rrp5 n=1 Tax=Collibacillus ludicampi TaxID=2771369 RepID=A0AAV4LHK9_9BACL|nr:hypothetical protein [Collibacillus ludicampi]GIM47004.1 hypothetical protein DNHGIG_25530 [Collibacillus ludicampi]
MNITLNIEASSPAELQEAITGLAGIVGGAVSPQPDAPTVSTQEEPEKPKRTNRTTTKPDKQQDPEPANEPEDKNAESPEPENVPTVVELRAKAQEKGKTPEGKKAIKALLEKFESKSISDIPEEKRAAFLAALEEL